MQGTIKVKGLYETQAVIQELIDKGNDTAPLMAELSNHLYNIVDESFEKEQTPDGQPWEPIQFRENDRHPEKILYSEGTMQGSLTQSSDETSAEVGLNATADGYPYPIVHQFGTEDGRIKSREFMPIHDDETLYEETIKELEEIVEDYINL